MEDGLIKKLTQLRDLIKALSAPKLPQQASLVPALKPPVLKPISMPSVSANAAPKLPGVAPASNKDPKKMAEQLKNPRPKKPKMEVLKVEDNGQWSLEKAVPDFRQPKKINYDRPFVDPSHPTKIHADYNGFSGNMNTATPHQQDLIHGIDLAHGTSVDEKTINTGNKWISNPNNGKTMIVKPASTSELGDKEAQDYLGHLAPDGMNAARREVLAHNVAHDFGLGDYVPTTAGFTKKGEDYSAQEKVPGISVRSVLQNTKASKKHSEHLRDAVTRMHETGDLHKLAFFDAMMGNNDRHLGNVLLHPHDKKIYHIDNGRAMDYRKENVEPSRLLGVASRAGLQPHVHQKASEWLNGLDESKVSKHLDQYVEPDSDFKKNFLNRLHNLKMLVKHNPKLDVHSLIKRLGNVEDGTRLDDTHFERTKLV